MTRPYQTVRTDLRALRHDEEIPPYLRPKRCGIHFVSWWTDDLTLSEAMGKMAECPCCNGDLPIRMLLTLERVAA